MSDLPDIPTPDATGGTVREVHLGAPAAGEVPRRARIYKPARNAMQSGTARSRNWVLDFEPANEREIDPLMGWTSSDDTQRQVRLRFETREQAEAYAKAHGIEVVAVLPAQPRAPNIRPRGYGENFTPDRRMPWTH